MTGETLQDAGLSLMVATFICNLLGLIPFNSRTDIGFDLLACALIGLGGLLLGHVFMPVLFAVLMVVNVHRLRRALRG